MTIIFHKISKGLSNNDVSENSYEAHLKLDNTIKILGKLQ